MNINMDLILGNVLNPPVLFFFLGMFSVLVKSDLAVPEAMSKFFSMYLLFSIGFKGGHELSSGEFTIDHFYTLLACMFMALFVPIYVYFIMKTKFDVHNASAIAASFGSVSAVTFVTAGSFLGSQKIAYAGFIVAGMALMESPAIVLGVILDRFFSGKKDGAKKIEWGSLLHESFLNGSILLLVGSLLIGAATGEKGWDAEKPLTESLFKGFLSFFLLDMGMSAARRIRDIKSVGIFLLISAITIVIINATMGIFLSKLIGLKVGDALMFTVLCASASYIAVPAAMRLAIPQANPSIYLPVSLALVFPFNIIIGIPMYFAILTKVLN